MTINPCTLCGAPTNGGVGMPICDRCSTWGPDQHQPTR